MDTAPRWGYPIDLAVEVHGDPWATLVLRDIMFGSGRHLRELFAGSEEGIASNILAHIPIRHGSASRARVMR